MSIHFDDERCIMELDCDHCDRETESYEGDSWDEALAFAKADGWRVFKDGNGDWVVKCPGCVRNATMTDESDRTTGLLDAAIRAAMAAWDATNRRRCELIDKEIGGSLSDAQATELAVLQTLADRQIDLLAPFPLTELDRVAKRLRLDYEVPPEGMRR